jgi:hypothetical protein
LHFSYLSSAWGYATYTPCDQPLTAGTQFIGLNAVSDASRSVVVTRSVVPLESGSVYAYNETLAISLNSTSGDYILESEGAFVFGGDCVGSSRVYGVSAMVLMPVPGVGTVRFRSAWTTSNSVPVRITPDFVL